MTARDPFSDDGPEIVPPAELLRLRARLSRPPAPAVRAQHLAAAVTAARQPGVAGKVGRFATRGARVAVAVVASLAITSSLAGAQLLPQPAQRLLSSVSDRFAPEPDAPPARSEEPDGGDGTSTTDSQTEADRDAATTAAIDSSGAGGSGGDTTTSIAPVTPTTTARVVVAPTTTIPGPVGPGSPTDPTDPGPTDPTTTTTVDPGSTTTTTDPSTTTTSTTTPGGSTTTTTEGTTP